MSDTDRAWKELLELMRELVSRRQKEAQRTLLIKVHIYEYSISWEELDQIFSPVGSIEYIEVFDQGSPFHSRIRFIEPESAVKAIECFDGRCIYNGCCRMELSLGDRASKLSEIDVPSTIDQTLVVEEKTTKIDQTLVDEEPDLLVPSESQDGSHDNLPQLGFLHEQQFLAPTPLKVLPISSLEIMEFLLYSEEMSKTELDEKVTVSIDKIELNLVKPEMNPVESLELGGAHKVLDKMPTTNIVLLGSCFHLMKSNAPLLLTNVTNSLTLLSECADEVEWVDVHSSRVEFVETRLQWDPGKCVL